MYVLFLYGPAAVGKHTIGSIVARRLSVPLFHNHLAVDLAASLFAFGTPPFCRLRADIWRSAFENSARSDVSFVFTFHPESTVDPALITELTHIVTDSKGTVIFVELTCARSTVLDRLANESRTRFGKLTDPALYEAIEAEGGFEFDGMPVPDLRVDTDALLPESAAEHIDAFVRQRMRRA